MEKLKKRNLISRLKERYANETKQAVIQSPKTPIFTIEYTEGTLHPVRPAQTT
jgi:hypothetical protein